MPTFTHGKNAKVLANGVDLTSWLREASIDRSAETAETTAFGDSNKKYIAGQRSATLSAGGMFEGSTNGVDDVFNTALGVDGGELVYLPNGDAAGAGGHGLQGIVSTYGVEAPVDDVVKVSMETTSCATDRIVSLGAATTYIEAGTTAAVDNGTITALGYAAYLFVPSCVGAGTVICKVQHSADDITYADLVTFTGVTASQDPASERKAGTASVERYTRLVVNDPDGVADAGTATVWAGVSRRPANP